MASERGKRPANFFDKIMKKEKVKSRADRVTLKGRSVEDDAAEATKFLHFQQNISRLSDSELNIKFEQMLDDMNLTEELKAPLRKKSTKEKRDLLQMQFKGTIRAKGSIDSPEEFAELFNSCEKLKGDKRYEVMASLRVALTNNPVSWAITFGKRNGLNGILRNLNYSFDNKSEQKSTLECIRCLRAYMNSKHGLMQILSHEEALTLICRCIDLRDHASMLETVRILAAICLVPPDGHEKVLEGITNYGEIRGHDRFLPIVQGLSVEDPQMKARQNVESAHFIDECDVYLLHHNNLV